MAGRSSTGLIRGDVISGQRNASRKYIVGCACAAIGPTGGVGQSSSTLWMLWILWMLQTLWTLRTL